MNAIGQRSKVTTSGTAFALGTNSAGNTFWDYNLTGEVIKADAPAARRVKKAMPCLLNQHRLSEVRHPTKNALIASYQNDSLSRRVATNLDERRIYGRWNAIGQYKLHHSSFILHTSYTWGLDLSGSMQGAGGVGGLLLRNQSFNFSASPYKPYYPTYDGNGNIVQYLLADKTIALHLEYDPFGRLIIQKGSETGSKPQNLSQLDGLHRFSTKPLDQDTGFYYYGYRFYDPETGRWPSRDPIGERGGMNLYRMVGNDMVNRGDYLGLVAGVYDANPHGDLEEDDVKIDKLEKVRSLVFEGVWDSRDAAGEYGARAAVFLTQWGPRVAYRNYVREVEYGGRVCCRCEDWNGKMELKYTLTGPYTSLLPSAVYHGNKEPCPKGTVQVGEYHSHPSANGPSDGDYNRNRHIDRMNSLLGNGEHPCIKANRKSRNYIGERIRGDSRHGTNDRFRLITIEGWSKPADNPTYPLGEQGSVSEFPNPDAIE